MLSRRRILSLTLRLPATRVAVRYVGLPIALTSSITTSANAAFPWMAAIAVASTVACLIAANNRGDGGIGAALEANLQTTTLVLENTRQIQIQVADVLSKLMLLPEQIDNLLRHENTRRLQVELMAVIRGYLEKLIVRDTVSSDEEWRTPGLIRDVGNLLNRLQKARQELAVEQLVDPATALVVSPLMYVENSLMVILQYNTAERNGMLNEYGKWFDGILDQNSTLSAYGYAAGAQARMADHIKRAKATKFGYAIDGLPKDVQLACVGIDDTAPGWRGPPHCRPDRIPFGSTGEGENLYLRSAPNVSADNRPVEGAWIMGVQNASAYQRQAECWEGDWHEPALRAQDRMARYFSLSEENLLDSNQHDTGVKIFKIDSSTERRPGNAGFSRGRLSPNCEIATKDLPDPDARQSAMNAMLRDGNASVEFDKFTSAIDSINLEHCRMALGFAAMAAARSAKDRIALLKDRG